MRMRYIHGKLNDSEFEIDEKFQIRSDEATKAILKKVIETNWEEIYRTPCDKCFCMAMQIFQDLHPEFYEFWDRCGEGDSELVVHHSTDEQPIIAIGRLFDADFTIYGDFSLSCSNSDYHDYFDKKIRMILSRSIYRDFDNHLVNELAKFPFVKIEKAEVHLKHNYD